VLLSTASLGEVVDFGRWGRLKMYTYLDRQLLLSLNNSVVVDLAILLLDRCNAVVRNRSD
jgi:hypothetical protein